MQFHRNNVRSRSRRRITLGIGLTLLAAGLTAPTAAAETPPPFPISAGPNFTHLAAPLTTSHCQAVYGIRCYSPAQLQAAYRTDDLYRRGIDGRGTTIVVPVPFGSPTIQHDLEVYDKQFNLPDPELQIVQFGDIPPYDPTDFTRLEWAAGTTMVVENAHALAPRAKIVIAETAVSEEDGTSGFPELFQAESALIKAGVGDVIAQIEGTGERTFPGYDQGDYSSLLNLRGTYQEAAAHGVTVLAAGGNSGSASGSRWPASDPLVTAVGGSQLYLDDAGAAVHQPTTWNDGYGGVGGGGVSTVFGRPAYQDGVAGVVGNHRGTPDITMSASVDGGGWIYASFAGTGGIGWDIFDGTGQAMGLFAGIVALADQAAGHRLGLINPALNVLGAESRHGGVHRTGLVDIVQGNTTANGRTGYDAAPGYDLATGWGTIDAATFVPALGRAVRHD